MSKPHVHAKSSARRFGGNWDEYTRYHEWFDASKEWFPDNRHRVFRHHTEGIFECARVFGSTFVNSAGRTVSVRDIGEMHVSEDFGGKFIPCVADYLNGMELEGWMNNGIGGSPPSYKKVAEYMDRRKPTKTVTIPFVKEGEDIEMAGGSKERERLVAGGPVDLEVIHPSIPPFVVDGTGSRIAQQREGRKLREKPENYHSNPINFD